MTWAANTAIHSKSPSPGVQWLWNHFYIDEGMECLDYGAGHGRNAAWLRDRGVTVYAYDPNHGSDERGWSGVSDTLPDSQFDFAFTSYVLNVLPKEVEGEVISDVRAYAPTQAHIVRGDELLDEVSKMFVNRNSHVQRSWMEFKGDMIRFELEDFCRFGVHTGPGRYQRLSRPNLSLVYSIKAWKVYIDQC